LVNDWTAPEIIILHAGWLDGQVLVWGEMPVVEAPSRDKLRGQQAWSAAVAPLPYGVPNDVLAHVLVEAASGLEELRLQPASIILWLPTAGGIPLASGPLIAPTPDTSSAPALAPWSADALRLDRGSMLLLLSRCADCQTLGPGLLIAEDVRYWVQCMRFAASLVTRQAFLPGMEMIGHTYVARWQPFIGGQDELHLEQLAAAMPGACRALSHAAGEPPATTPRLIVRALMAALTDHLVREAAGGNAGPPAVPQTRARGATFDSLHDQWLAALRTRDGRMDGDPQALAAFATHINEWAQAVSVGSDPSVRLCFRLEEPAPDGAVGDEIVAATVGDWRVEYLLQATDDPSLLVAAQDVWRARGRRGAMIRREIAAPREKLLAALGRAAAVAPSVAASLHTSEPTGYSVDTTGAYAFLTETAWLLEQAGFGVLLPFWWVRRGHRLKLAAHTRPKGPKMSGNRLSLDALVDVDWEIALGDRRLTHEELEALARLKAPLVRIRGQWVQINAQELQAALEFWKQTGSGQMSLRQVVHMAIGTDGAGPASGGLRADRVEADGWIGDLLARLEGRAALEPLPPPAGLHGTLRPYQERGYAWLRFLTEWGLGACLADDMGLGKTVQTLALIARDRAEGATAPVLLICPTSVIENWRKETQRFTPDLSVLIHHGSGRHRAADFLRKARQHALVLSSYSLLYRDLDLFKGIRWRGLVLDEAQNIKNAETKQAQAARSVPADYRVALTGTPVENNIGDLWSLMDFLNPGLLGSQAQFRRHFFVPIQVMRDADSITQLKRLTSPFVLRRLKTDRAIIADLPEKQEIKDYCTLTREQASLYRAVLKELEEPLDKAEGIQRKGVILATLMKLKQVCNHPAQFLGDHSAIADRSGKLMRLEAMLEEVLAEGDRALIFTQFAAMGELLKRYLQRTLGVEVLFLHGGTSRLQRTRMIERFQQEEGGPPLFILSLKAGGTGLNLTRASQVFHFDRWWNPAVENQATDRAFRIGQRQHVQVHKFVCAGTLEERIDELIESKREIASHVTGTGEGWLTELSTAQLKELFALRPDAVED
jgi:SNF2 family DNA or RNA helicase